MSIPPHAARLVGAWAVQTTRPAPHVARVRRDRSRRITVARVLHPLHRPQPVVRLSAQRSPEPRSRCQACPTRLTRRTAYDRRAAVRPRAGRAGRSRRLQRRRHRPRGPPPRTAGEHHERRLGGVLPRGDHRAGPAARLDEARGLELLEGAGHRVGREAEVDGERPNRGSRSPGTSRPERISASTCARTCSKGASRAAGSTTMSSSVTR